MLLVKLQQWNLLVEHLSKMMAKFQNDSQSLTRSELLHSLAMLPTGSPELIQAGEVLVAKLPNDPSSQIWVAIMHYRAGKYEEAESLFSAAAGASPLSLCRGTDGTIGRQFYRCFMP